MPRGGAVLVSVIEVQVELGSRINEGVHFRRTQGHHSNAGSVNHILPELAENMVLFVPEQQKTDRMQCEIRDLEFVTLAVFEEGPGVAGAGLIQQHFDEDVGIDKQSHSPSVLQRAIRCCKSTEVYCSRNPSSAPAHVNCGLPGRSMARRASKNCT
jgi:hypothetical protein